MIDQYTAHMIARTEHGLMKQSLASVQEGYLCPVAIKHPNWLSTHIKRLRCALKRDLGAPVYHRKTHTSAKTERISMGGHELT